jgi:surfactin synthase thioesterase subunit
MKLADGYLILERPNATVRLIVVHHAGGSAMSYLPLARQLPESCEPCLIDLPGRGTQDALPPAADFRTAIDQTMPAMAALVDRPVIVVGHSLGALVAHSLVAALPASQRANVQTVVVSAFPSPQDTARVATHPDAPARSRDSMLGELRDRGGCPAEVFDDPEWLDGTIALLGKDLHLADTYRPPPAIVDAGYHVWYGRDDRHLATEELAGWAAVTSRPLTTREFRGGHFYLTEGSRPALALADLIALTDQGGG